MKKEAWPLLPEGQELLHRQAVVSAGLAFRAQRRVDLGVEVQRGFGDGSPFYISLICAGE